MIGFGHWPELLVILLVVLIFVGPKRLPEVGGSLGKAIREFRGATSGLHDAGQPSSTATGDALSGSESHPTS